MKNLFFGIILTISSFSYARSYNEVILDTFVQDIKEWFSYSETWTIDSSREEACVVKIEKDGEKNDDVEYKVSIFREKKKKPEIYAVFTENDVISLTTKYGEDVQINVKSLDGTKELQYNNTGEGQALHVEISYKGKKVNCGADK